jgi:hypothetical protein
VAAAVQRAESKAVDGVFAILGLPRVEGPLTAQITLPHRHGGLGLSHTCPAEGSAAYLAAAAITHQAMRHGPAAFRPFGGPSGEQLRPQWASLHSGAGDLWPPEFQEVSPDSLGTIAAAQREFSRQAAQACADALSESLCDAGTQDGKSARAHLLSCACHPSSAWLDTLPHQGP